MNCPNCGAAMTAKPEEAFGALPRPIEVDCCTGCGLLWFDAGESVRLTPRAVLSLFQLIGQAAGSKRPLLAALRCPRCEGTLSFTHDMQRTTHFTYWRCMRDHGHLITFTQFLAEKNFIRAPSPAELARLREHVRQINCSQCGAPVDLANDSACRHCGAPVTIIDPDGVTKALRELTAGANPAAPSSEAIRDAQINAIFELERMRREEATRHDDLVTVGATAIGALLASFLSN